MNTSIQTVKLKRKQVYDPVLRLLHGWNALAIVILLLTGWSRNLLEPGPVQKGLWQFHILVGYGLVAGVTSRILWGLIGPEAARLRSLWHPKVWIASWRSRTLRHEQNFGHDPYASIAYLLVYGALIAISVSGLTLAAIEHDVGPLRAAFADKAWLKPFFKEPHEALALGVAVFIALHLGGIFWHERKHGTPVAQSMLSGFQYRKIPLILALLSLAALLSSRELRAGGGSVADGDRFYHAEHTSGGRPISCATCHTADPRQRGMTRANKEIEPLAPSVNPQRFTDPEKVEKWFSRNCRDVLGRSCTAREKEDFIQYVRSVK